MNNQTTNIIEGKLSISYEAADVWVSNDQYPEGYPEQAVLLYTRCCKINHDHISLSKKQAMVLAKWLVAFAGGEYDTEVT